MRKVGEAGRQSTMFGVLKKYGKGKIRLRKSRLKPMIFI
jgi:hypothetical protein